MYAPGRLVVEQGGGHLGASGVVGADEQHFGDVGHAGTFQDSVSKLGGRPGAGLGGPGGVDTCGQ